MVTLDPRRLLVLAAVSDRGGVVAAADMLHLTPSAVSQQLVRLERESGVALVDRSRRQARLTVAGEHLADRGRAIANQLSAAEADIAEWFGATGTSVVIGAFSSVIKRLLIPVLTQLDVGHDVTVSLVERESRRAIAELHAGDIDIAIVEAASDGTPLGAPLDARRERDAPATGRLRTALVLLDDYRIVVPADWPVATWSDDGVLIDELARRPWVASSRGSAARDALTDLGAAWEFTPRVDHDGNELATVLALVGAGLGAAVVPQLAWADVTDRTLLLDTGDIAAAGDVPASMGACRIAALVRWTPRGVPAIELCLAALRRAAEAEELVVDEE